MLQAVSLAIAGGLLWSFGVLGKRIGVHGAPPGFEGIRATCTMCVYTLVTLMPSLMDFALTERGLLRQTFGDPAWRGHIPGIMVCGLFSGLGGILGTVAMASAGSGSALISMVENGVYTVAGTVLIAIFFGEHPPPTEWVSAFLIMCGILTAHSMPEGQQEEGVSTKGKDSGNGKVDNYVATPSEDVEEALECANSTEKEAEGGIADADAIRNSDEGEAAGKSPEGPAPKRAALSLAILAGACWGLGPVGKKYGVEKAPAGHEHVRTTCTYVVYMSCTLLVPVFNVLRADAALRAETLGDPAFLRLLAGTGVCGMVSGLGGLLSTLAFAMGAEHSALVSMIENGLYTVAGALLITVTFKERPTARQLWSAGLVVAGLLVSAGS